MEHLDLYIYLALGGLYLISKLLKGATKSHLPNAPSQQTDDAPEQAQTDAKPRRRPAFSFEELLKEFEQQYEQKQPEPKPGPEAVKQEKKPAPERKEEVEVRSYPTYEDMSVEEVSNKHLEGSLMADRFKRDEHYAKKEVIVNDYIKMLREPGGLRNAIVMSEIMNRKYF